MTIGREAADITIEDPEISRRHAEVRMAGGDLEVEDLGSTNGTYLNRRKVTSASAVQKGDRIKIGKTVMELRR